MYKIAGKHKKKNKTSGKKFIHNNDSQLVIAMVEFKTNEHLYILKIVCLNFVDGPMRVQGDISIQEYGNE